MLTIKVWDEDQEVVLKLEHSLLSLSKWESIHQKAFLTADAKTPTEMIDYFECMVVSPEGCERYVSLMEPEQLDEVANYINKSLTASRVQDEKSRNNETVTSELIYYWLSQLRIPFHPTETWHLSRLMMLVRIANFKAQPAKKQRVGQMMSEWRAANAARKAEYGTSG